MGGRAWTDQELKTVRRLYPSERWAVLLKHLPGRSKAAIRCQVIAQSIRREYNSRSPWKGSQLVALRRLYPTGKWLDILEACAPHTYESILQKARELGVKRDRAEVVSRYAIIRMLRAERRRIGVSREHIANQIGIHTVQLSNWERGQQMPRLRGFFDWVEALGFRLELQRGTKESR